MKQQHPPPSSGLNSTTSRPQLPSKLPKEEEEEEVGGKDAAEDSNAQGEPSVEAENHTGEDEEKEVCPVTVKVFTIVMLKFFCSYLQDAATMGKARQLRVRQQQNQQDGSLGGGGRRRKNPDRKARSSAAEETSEDDEEDRAAEEEEEEGGEGDAPKSKRRKKDGDDSSAIPDSVRFDPNSLENKPKGLVDSLTKYFTPGVKRTSRTALNSLLKPNSELEAAAAANGPSSIAKDRPKRRKSYHQEGTASSGEDGRRSQSDSEDGAGAAGRSGKAR